MNTATNPHDLKVLLERKGILQTGQFAAPTSPELTRSRAGLERSA